VRRDELIALWQRAADEPVAADAIYATLREAILSGVLAQGERLGEVQLADLFKRSRTPVREAMLRLESERLTQRVGRRGFVVGRITREEVLEVYAVRVALDGLAARVAAISILPGEVDELRWINDQLRAAAERNDSPAMISLNIEFHERIAQASRNSQLLQFMRQIHDRVRRFSETTLSYPGRLDEALNEHAAIVAALAQRQPVEAEQAACAHMQRAMAVRIHVLQQRTQRG
jgi:DNA-binding GntR family transcriptional regulator